MTPSDLKIEKAPNGALLLTLAGEWKLGNIAVSPDGVLSPQTAGEKARRVSFETSGIEGWDSGLLIFLARLFEICRRENVTVDASGLPAGVRKLMELASAKNQRSGVTRGQGRLPFLARVGDAALDRFRGTRAVVEFIGAATLAFFRMLRGKAVFRRLDLVTAIHETGVQALPIVTLITLLVGMILAFVAAIQLKMFGAQIYVADVVGIGIVRVMGAIMTGIIMSGRTGAAFAAQLGTMQVNEEIDALETLGFSPVELSPNCT